MAKYLSNRQQNLKIGIVSYTENNTVLEITGNVGIGTTNATHDLDINGDIRIRGALYDKDNQEGTSGQLLVSTATGVDWQDANAISVIQTLINTSLTGIEVKEEGVSIGTTFTAVNFVSSNITATASGNQAIITLTDSPSFTNANVTGVSTIGTVKISSGIITATSGIVTYYGDGQYLDLTNNPSTGIGIGTTGGVVGYGITFLDLKGAGVSSTFYNSSVGIATIFFEGGGGGGSISISTTAPTSPGSGDLWYSPDYGRTFIYYDESTVGYGTDAFWVDAAPFNTGIDATLVGVAFSAGSAISPSLYFAGDVQTGFFSPTPGQFTVVSTGSSILNVNPSGIRVTGVSTFSSVNVTGNVSIGGTLTYDDVTNVDSIGLVTARTGVRIDAGGLVVTAGVSTFTNGPVLIGSATSTGTATQRLQVTGGAYVSGNLGIGTTNPQAKVHIVGSGSTALLVDGDVRVVGILTVGSSSITFDGINNTVSIGAVRLADESGNANYSGIITATTFVGALTGTASNVTTNANLTGDITSVGNATAIATGVIVNADINASAAIAVSKLAASTISGVTLGNNLNALTISTGLSGSSYNGSGAVTIAIDSTVATLTGTQTLTNKTLTSPTLTTPALGTPSSGTLTSCTGLPVSTGISGLAANVATFLATPSSANLISAVTNETGTGSLVFATSPTLVTPVLGTPSSGTLTSCTGLPIVAGTTGTLSVARGGTGVTASTGTGSVVLSTSPTLTTPVLGSASASSINVSGVSTFGNTVVGGGTTQLIVTGDARITGNQATTLATVNSNVGTFGNGTSIPTITVNAKGLITGVTTTAVTSGTTITDDTTTNALRFLTFTSATSGSISTANVSSTKLQFNPSTGAVGIGTAIDIVPYDNLNSGTLSFEGSAGQLFSITNNLTSGSIFSVNDVSGIPSIDVDANGTIQLAPYGGNIGVGTTNPTSKLTVVGDVLVSGIVTCTDINTTSDANLKGNIQTFTNALDAIENIRGVRFEWKENSKPSVGVVAQEIEKVIPELVTNTNPKTVNYNGLIGVLIEAVKEQQVQINTLKEQIEDLKNER
jgi:hypothetical protein